MPSPEICDGELCLGLSLSERLGAARLSDFCVPVSAITKVESVTNPFTHVGGLRLPGTYVPGVVALGTFLPGASLRRAARGSGRIFVVSRNKRPGYLVELTDHRYSRIILSTKSSPLLEQLKSDLEPQTDGGQP